MKIIKCPHCESEKVKENGSQKNGKKRYRCKSCGKTFQEFLPYDAKRFFSTLYELIKSSENRITFEKNEIDKFIPKFENKTRWREIVIKDMPKNLQVESYNPKIAIVYDNETQIQIFKFNGIIDREKPYIIAWNDPNKSGTKE